MDRSLPDREHEIVGAHLGVASWLVALALVFCFLPPFDKTKLYICWPLTAMMMFLLLLSVPL